MIPSTSASEPKSTSRSLRYAAYCTKVIAQSWRAHNLRTDSHNLSHANAVGLKFLMPNATMSVIAGPHGQMPELKSAKDER